MGIPLVHIQQINDNSWAIRTDTQSPVFLLTGADPEALGELADRIDAALLATRTLDTDQIYAIDPEQLEAVVANSAAVIANLSSRIRELESEVKRYRNQFVRVKQIIDVMAEGKKDA